MLDIAELLRRLHNLACLGTVSQVDHDRGLCRVHVGERETGWLPVPGYVGENYRAWHPVRVGTQVLLVSPSGDPANAIITQILYSHSLSPPAQGPTDDVILFDDGFRIRYDSATHRLEIDAPGEIHIKAQGPVTVDAQDTVTLNAGGDMILNAGGDIRVAAAGTLHLDGSAIRALEG